MDLYFNSLNSGQVMAFGLMWNILPIIGAILVHLAFSAAVFNDANKLQREHGSLERVDLCGIKNERQMSAL